MRKKIIAFILMIFMILTSLPALPAIPAHAYDGTETDTTGWIQGWTHLGDAGNGGTVEWAIDPEKTVWVRPENGAAVGTMPALQGYPWNHYSENNNTPISFRIAKGTTIFAPGGCSAMFMYFGVSGKGIIDLTGLDTSNTRGTTSMFCDSRVKVIKLGNTFDTSNVNAMDLMFYKSKAATIDLGDKFDTSNVRLMSNMFYSSSATKIDLGDKFDTSNVTNMSHMFCLAKATEINLGNKFDTSQVTGANNMKNMFECPNLNRIYLSGCITNWQNNAYLNSNLTSTTENKYTGKWIREDESYGPLTAEELGAEFPQNAGAMAGWWVMEEIPTKYTINFSAPDETFAGSMLSVKTVAAEDYTLPKNNFA